MSKSIFRNYEMKSIKNLLQEIGKERYEGALLDAGLSEMKPIGMKGFYLEWDNQDVHLYYKYPSGTICFIIDALGFGAVPAEGWVMERKSY